MARTTLVLNEESHTSKPKINVFWFRRDLRLNDNCGLWNALNSGLPVLPIFIFDTAILSKLQNKEDKRVDFIHRSLKRLHDELHEIGSGLQVLQGTPLEALDGLLKKYSISTCFANHDYEPYAIDRDEGIRKFLTDHSVEFKTFKDQVFFEKSEIIKADNTPYTIFTPYSKVWKAKIQELTIQVFSSELIKNNFFKIDDLEFPTIESIGFKKSTLTFELRQPDETVIKNYHETRNIPSIVGTTGMSVHLRFGTVSCRELIRIAMRWNEQWLNELIWREFFMSILFHFPHVVHGSFKKKYDGIVWRNNEFEFQKWCDGETGYPIVDAGMRELNETGLMHNRVRMIVASFLTKHLLIDWRWGENYFAEKLLDYDLSANNGNWQWASGSGCDSAPYFRIFNPYEQVKRYDPDLIYIKKWVANLQELNYPSPIVDHKMARERVLLAYKNALADFM